MTNWNGRFATVIYALIEDTDYMVFDSDLHENRQLDGTGPSEYTPVLIVNLNERARLELEDEVARLC